MRVLAMQGAGQGTAAQAGAASGTAGASASPRPKRVFVVGCGHSGTSLLKRTVANLPGLLCIPKESNLFMKKELSAEAVQQQVEAWDAAAAAGGFSGFVEKSPKHVQRLGAIFDLDSDARAIFIVRDGRDVAASMGQRQGYTFEAGLDRWVHDNSAILPYANDSRVMTVHYEAFADDARVLCVLRQLSDFVAAPVPGDHRLLLALQPSSWMLAGGEQCGAFESEAAKEADLAASYLQLLSAGAEEQRQQGAEEAPDKSTYHNKFRSWQSSQVWRPQHGSPYLTLLTKEQQAAVAANQTLQGMLAKFGYT